MFIEINRFLKPLIDIIVVRKWETTETKFQKVGKFIVLQNAKFE